MTIRTIIAGASGGTASDGTIDLACSLAHRFGAHLEALHVGTDVQQTIIGVASADLMGGSVSQEWIDGITQEVTDIAAKTKKAFAAAVLSEDTKLPHRAAPGAWSDWHATTGDASLLLPDRARFFDLVVLGRSDRVVDHSHSDVIEQTLLQSGRPVLVAPVAVPAVIGETVMVAWDGSPQAVRAVAAALPWLTDARSVDIVTIGDDSDSDPGALISYLSHHGVVATLRNVAPVPGASAGALLLSAALENRADLLVMGGYGHAPWREFLFGGASRDTIGTSLLPLLLQH